jgi:flagellar motor switch protein FliN/FliY
MIDETSSSTATEAEAVATKDHEEAQTVGSAAEGSGTPQSEKPKEEVPGEHENEVTQGTVKKADFQPLSDTPSGGPGAELEMLYDVNLPVSVELGRTLMTVGEMLAVCQGSVIPLERATGEPVDVLVSGKVIGKGEVVVVDDKFGVRITELVNRLDGIGKP